jgi:ribosome maturation factor RimP
LDTEDLKQTVAKIAEAKAAGLGLDLVETALSVSRNGVSIRLYADRPTGGVTIDDCSSLNRQVDEQIYEEVLPDGKYTLEVSSPGLDRDLLGYRDFRRVVGRDVLVFLAEACNGKTQWQGELVDVTEEHFVIRTKKEDCLIPFCVLKKGKQVII